jgi:probable phosphoglycerate mutase
MQLEPDLMDIELGHWSGQNRDALFQSDPAWKAFVRDPLEAPADVETFPKLEQRVVRAVENWLQKDTTGPLPAFVTHADVIKVLLAHYLGLELGHARSLVIDNASVSVVALESGKLPLVLTISWNPQPGWLYSFTPALDHIKSERNIVGEQNA